MNCSETQGLLAGYLDGEIPSSDREEVEAHLEGCAECRGELDEMRVLVDVTTQLQVAQPEEEVWDSFLDGVYNRVERKSGWLLLILGVLILSAMGLFYYVVQPWTSVTAKMAFGLPFVGLAILFISVLRERLSIRGTDRYSRDVHR